MNWAEVWRHTFTTEEEADVAYELMERETGPLLDVDRLTGTTVTAAFSASALEAIIARVEESYHPPTEDTLCICGHRLVLHDEADEEGTCHVCQCPGYERADWPTPELLLGGDGDG